MGHPLFFLLGDQEDHAGDCTGLDGGGLQIEGDLIPESGCPFAGSVIADVVDLFADGVVDHLVGEEGELGGELADGHEGLHEERIGIPVAFEIDVLEVERV